MIYLASFRDPVALAARNWPLVLIGVCGALIGNLTAIGGGVLFIPTLIFFYQTDPLSALKLALITQAVGMTSGAVGWLQSKTVPVEPLKWLIPALVVGSAVSTFLWLPKPELVKGVFGPVSVLVGVLTLSTLGRQGCLERLPQKALLPLSLFSAVGGLITGWAAIGSGEIVAASAMLVYRLEANKAIGLGVVLLAVNSLLLTGVHALWFGGVPWDLAAFTMLGVLWGGRLGPYIAQRTASTRVKRLFAWIAILDGSLLFFLFFGKV